MKNRLWTCSVDTGGVGGDLLARGPERLVGLGFRYWMLGHQTGDIECWAQAWNVYREALGCKGAGLALSQLSSWVRTLAQSTSRDIAVGSEGDCCGFCRDERLAIAMVAACQHEPCPAVRACAFALIENAMLDEVLHQTECFGSVMRTLGQILSPTSFHSAGLVVDPVLRRHLH